MDKDTLDLPEQYFDKSIKEELFETLQDGELNLEAFDPSAISDDYAMPEEETIKPLSTTAKQMEVSGEDSQSSEAPARDITPILSEIEGIDNKIKDLENNLTKLIQTKNKDFSTEQLSVPETALEDSDEIVSVVNKNNFISQQDPDQVYNVDKPVNTLNTASFENINQVEPDVYNTLNKELSNEVNNQETLLQEINQLRSVKENLLNKLYYNKPEKSNVENSNNFSEANVKVDNFTPNFADIDSSLNTSLDRSINTENVFGNNPKVVKDSKGAPAVISGDQIDLKSAIEDHGGIDKAINDSINQQTYVSNFADSSFENISQKSNTFETSNKGGLNQFYSESILENNDQLITANNDSGDIVKNTSNTVAAINALSKEFQNLSRAITNGFNSINGRIREIKTNQTYNQSNSTQQTSNNYSSTSQGEKSKSIIPSNIRGNTPLSDHFPEGFNLDKLGGSNLAYRT